MLDDRKPLAKWGRREKEGRGRDEGRSRRRGLGRERRRVEERQVDWGDGKGEG